MKTILNKKIMKEKKLEYLKKIIFAIIIAFAFKYSLLIINTIFYFIEIWFSINTEKEINIILDKIILSNIYYNITLIIWLLVWIYISFFKEKFFTKKIFIIALLIILLSFLINFLMSFHNIILTWNYFFNLENKLDYSYFEYLKKLW